jgi:hypothetical protein
MNAQDLEDAYEGVRPEIKETFMPHSQSYLEFCKDWPVGEPISSIMYPVSSNVPTLIMNGDFDPITPSRYGHLVAEALEKNQLFDMPATGHGTTQGPAMECANTIIFSFLADPTKTVDASCIEDIEPLSFENPTYYLPNFPRKDLLPPRVWIR